ncbi:unnamed protein product [Caenorhabditis auriculariae]|uniref:Uncharacterized protein n=1 Tax=Caenorhabditis auriculariae TaxID=2777116 RepID=A0A8S1GUH7_9PELO|nr:unnamed protein product [Caenorhabditis auriculariae]
MFRRAFVAASKLAAGVGSVQLAAGATGAVVMLTDKELSRKPEWYQQDVRSLENALKKLSRYGYIESESVLNEALAALEKVSNFGSSEIQWRLARVYTEKARLTKDHATKSSLLHKAQESAKRALASEGSLGCAGAHKWYAISATDLAHVDKKKPPASTQRIPTLSIFLASNFFNKKDFKGAIDALEKAEGIKARFSAANLYYLGAAQRAAGKKDDAISTLKQAMDVPGKYSCDGKARSQAKLLLAKLGLKPEDYTIADIY